MSKEIERKNMMVDWQVAPAAHEICNYDEPEINYRQQVEEIVRTTKTPKRMPIIIISTNVMCADIDTSITKSQPHVDPINRDIYFALEIALTKCCVTDANKSPEERTTKSLHYIFNPGQPPANGSVKWSKDHKESFHKIDYEKFRPNDKYIENDIKKVIKEINAFLTPERIVYSSELRNCRQDLGCLKWLNREAGYIMKPVKVFSIEDLYVALNRRLCPTVNRAGFICQGVARCKLNTSDTYDPEIQCYYHQDKLLEDEISFTSWCAQAVASSLAHSFLDEVAAFQEMEENLSAVTHDSPITGH